MKTVDRVQRRLSEAPARLPFSLRTVGFGRLPPDGETHLRSISFAHLVWGVKGEGYQLRNGRWTKIPEAGICTFLPGDEHQLASSPQNTWEFRWLTLDGPLVSSIAAHLGFGLPPFHAGACPVSRFEELEKLLNIPGGGGADAAVTAAFDLVLEATRRRSSECSSENYPEDIAAAIELMRSRYVDPFFGVNVMAEELGQDRSSFSRKFARVTGMAPKQLLDSIRLREAKRMLGNQSQSVNSVALACGFSEAGYFTKFFIRNCGCTPTEYRRRQEF